MLLIRSTTLLCLLVLVTFADCTSKDPEDCYKQGINTYTHVGKSIFYIPLEKNGQLPYGLRVRIDQVYNGAYLVSAIMPKSGRTLSEATYATEGDMDFDPRLPVSSVRVKFVPGKPTDMVVRKDQKPMIRISIFGCFK